MIGLLVRLIPLAVIVLLTFLLNKDLDKLEEKKTSANWFDKIIWFVFGWTFKLKAFGTIIRYLATFLIFWWILNWAIVLMLR